MELEIKAIEYRWDYSRDQLGKSLNPFGFLSYLRERAGRGAEGE